MSTSWTEDFFNTKSGPLATVYACKLCRQTEIAPREVVREGGRARGRMIQHVKWAHWMHAQKAGGAK